MLQDSVLFSYEEIAGRTAAAEKTVVHKEVKRKGPKEIIFKSKGSFLSFDCAWQISDEVFIVQIYSTA